MSKQNHAVYITPAAHSALTELFKALGWEGQRGASFSSGLQWLGQTASYALPETIAALKIASGCAAGEDWGELVEYVQPDFGEPPPGTDIYEEN